MTKSKKPTREALQMANAVGKLFDELQKEWTAVVIVLRKQKP